MCHQKFRPDKVIHIEDVRKIQPVAIEEAIIFHSGDGVGISEMLGNCARNEISLIIVGQCDQKIRGHLQKVIQKLPIGGAPDSGSDI